jgi:hypothetical protein
VLQSSLDEMERGQSELDMLHKTAQGRLRELVRGISAAFVLVTDGRGRVLARIGQDEAVYRDALDGWPVVAQALRGYRLDDLWLSQGTLLRVAGSPVIANGRDRYIGAVVIGQVVGSDLAQAVHAATALDAVFVCSGRAVGGSRALPEPLLAELLALRPSKDKDRDAPLPPLLTRPGHDDVVAFVDLPGTAASQGAGLLLLAESPGSVPLLARLQVAAAHGMDPRWLVGLVLAVAAAFAVGLLLLRGEVEAPLSRLEGELRTLARRERGGHQQTAPQIHQLPTAGLRPLVLALNDLLKSVHRDAMQARPMLELPPLPDLPAERISQPAAAGSSWGAASGPVTPLHGASMPPSPPQPPPPQPMSRPMSQTLPPWPGVVPSPADSQPRPSLAPPDSAPPESGEPTRTTSFTERTRVAGSDGSERETDPELVDYRVYQEFILARERCSESVEGLNFDQFRRRLEQSRSEIIAQHRCHSVDFQVHIRDGRAVLRATPIWR